MRVLESIKRIFTTGTAVPVRQNYKITNEPISTPTLYRVTDFTVYRGDDVHVRPPFYITASSLTTCRRLLRAHVAPGEIWTANVAKLAILASQLEADQDTFLRSEL